MYAFSYWEILLTLADEINSHGYTYTVKETHAQNRCVEHSTPKLLIDNRLLMGLREWKGAILSGYTITTLEFFSIQYLTR